MKIQYVTGSRADFGLMRCTLQTLAAQPDLDLSIVATGQALIVRYGDVEGEVRDAGLAIAHRINVRLSGLSGEEMALAVAEELRGFVELWREERPDVVLLLGDRGEMLAAAIAAHHLGIAIAHIHGGELSGTLDEGFRHAISKLAHVHLVATEDSAERLVRMGEWPEAIHLVGAPGLVEVGAIANPGRDWLEAEFGVRACGRAALMVFHPVVHEQANAFSQTAAILEALRERNVATLIVRPNSDAGGAEIDRCLAEAARNEGLTVCDHVPRQAYLRALAAVDFLIGNSSSGIIESASLDTPCINLGQRQNGRLRNGNVIDVPHFARAAIVAAIDEALALRGPFVNKYGDGAADRRIAAALGSLHLTPELLQKRNRY